MIQRIQSVWLFVAAAVTFLTLKLSFYSGTLPADTLYHQLNGTDTILLMSTTILLGVLSLVNIFLFKKRKIQLRLTILAIVLELLLIFLFYRETTKFVQGEYAITAALHVVIILSLIFAARGINADEKLIRNSDRLR